MRNQWKKLCLVSVVLALAACGNISRVNSDGTSDNPIWPQLSDATEKHNGSVGTWPNWENVRALKKGMSKEQIMHLVGHPHFLEGFLGVREWDYVFNYRENDADKTCRLKILFDKHMTAQTYLWLPENCHEHARETAIQPKTEEAKTVEQKAVAKSTKNQPSAKVKAPAESK